MKIGIALSGGGVRATVFHLGVLARLAEENLLEDVTFLSTVSGGSLCGGLIYHANAYKWPSSAELRERVLPRVYSILTRRDLQSAYAWKMLGWPANLFRIRANNLSGLIRQLWGIRGSLHDIPDRPRWTLDATCYETGRNWRFSSKRMGDYVLGYAESPTFPICDAMAASSAFPGLIGSFVLGTRAWPWVKYKAGSTSEVEPTSVPYSEIHLWDGGLYDNLGVEALFKPEGEYRDGVDFLIVSDASGRFASQPYRFFWDAFPRLIGIATDQVRSLRARMVIDHFKRNPGSGSYLRIGDSGQYILRGSQSGVDTNRLVSECLNDAEVELAGGMETTIRRLTPTEFARLFRHGFEVANCTLFAFASGVRPWKTYVVPDWNSVLGIHA